MTDRAQFEAMLEALINEDQETAKDIFHNIVVGKSREIYEELLESDFPGSEEEEEETSDEPADDDGEEDDADDADDAFGDDSEDDEADDEASDNPFGDEEGDEEGDGDLEDRVLDLEDALEELKAEFEELLSGEESEPEHADMFGGEEEPSFGDEEGEEDEFGAEMGADDQEVKEIHHYHHDGDAADEEFQQFMEYVNKVALPKHGDNGVNNKSVVDNMKNNMGGKVIGRSADETKGGTQGGLLNPSTKPLNSGNVNVPGNSKAPKLNSVSKGHGAEKKGAGEKSVADKSIIGGK